MIKHFTADWALLALVLLLVALINTLNIAAQDGEPSRKAAALHYAEGAFIEAAQQWAALAAREPQAVDVRINAAQAYLQADDLGHAMLWFRRAQVLDPRHSAVQLGLALVRALRVDILEDEPGIMAAVERLSAAILSRAELAWLTILVWTAAFVIGAAAYLRRSWNLALTALVPAAVLLLLLMIGRELSVSTSPPAVVTAFESALTSEPGPDGVTLSPVYAGAEARIASQQGGWVLITLSDGRAGWLSAADVESLAE